MALVDDNMDWEVPYKQQLDHVLELEALLQQPYVHNQVVWLGLWFVEKVVLFVELLDIDGHAAVAAAASDSNDWDNSLSMYCIVSILNCNLPIAIAPSLLCVVG